MTNSDFSQLEQTKSCFVHLKVGILCFKKASPFQPKCFNSIDTKIELALCVCARTCMCVCA